MTVDSCFSEKYPWINVVVVRTKWEGGSILADILWTSFMDDPYLFFFFLSNAVTAEPPSHHSTV